MPGNPTAKKARKKQKAPQRLGPEVWKAIELAVVAGGLTFAEVARRFNVDIHTVMMRSRRGRWAVPTRISKRVRALQSERLRNKENGYMDRETAAKARECNDQAVEAAAESWIQKGERHRALSFDFAHNSLREIAMTGLPITDWAECEKADRMARRASGLDSCERSQNVNVAMQLVETRLTAISLALPKDAL